MVKKALIEIALSSNILVMDFTRNLSYNDLIISAKGTNNDLGNAETSSNDLKKNLLKCQQVLRELFSEYLYLCSILLKSSHTQDTLQLFNETLIFDELWQEGIKTFTISLFLSDLIGPATNKKELNHFQKQTLEDLRGVNIVNFDESNFFGSIVSMRDNQLFEMARQSVFKSLMFAKNILRYLKSVTRFFDGAI